MAVARGLSPPDQGRNAPQSKSAQPAKTLRDWFQLLLIPLAPTAAALALNQLQSDREQQREDTGRQTSA
jgi:hypothetical protein